MKKSALLLLENLSKNSGLILNATRLEMFNAFGDLLIERNKFVNLTSIEDETDIVVRHFYDSLSPAAYVAELRELAELTGRTDQPQSPRTRAESETRPKLADVGAGAGFPGLPLKILFGDAVEVTLIESTRKKVDFMNDVIRELGLTGCSAIHARAEEAARACEHGSVYNFVTARALAALPKAVEFCVPLLAPGGVFIAMKGLRETAARELALSGKQLTAARGQLSRVVEFTLDSTYERTLVIIRKT